MRPYARKVAGTPRYMRFDSADPSRTFVFAFTHSTDDELCQPTQPTEIFVPHFQYPDGAVDIAVSDGEFTYDRTNQTLFYSHGTARNEHRIVLSHKRASAHQRLRKGALAIQGAQRFASEAAAK